MSKMGKLLLIFGIIALVSAIAFGFSVVALGVTDNDWGVSISGIEVPFSDNFNLFSLGGKKMGKVGLEFNDNGTRITYDFEKTKDYSGSFDATGLSDITLDLASCHADIVCSDTQKVNVNYKTGNTPVEFVAQVKDGILEIKENMKLNIFNFGSVTHSELRVEVPASLYNSVKIELASGAVTGSGLTSDDLDINVASGSVDMSLFADDIKVNVASGRVAINNCNTDPEKTAGDIDVNVASGTVEMNGFKSESTKAQLASGKVILTGISGKVKGELASGKLTLTYAEWTDDLDVELMSGGVDVTLPTGSGVNAKLERLSGSMTIDLDGQNGKLTGNSSLTVGGPNVHNVKAETASGNISIHN